MVVKTRHILSLSLLGLTLTGLSLSTFAAEGRSKQHMLERMDDNKDGVISMEEFQSPMEGRMSRADADNDGEVTLNEIELHRAERMAEHEAQRAEHEARRAEHVDMMSARFQAMDTDGSGGVTPEEARIAAFNHMDSNQDGSLSVDELRRPEGQRGMKGKRKHKDQ
ncbi:MAG: Ca2+-binding EF-hand superfamily protein [Cyclobacteriaceae bacterium]|jgi:Ca2+-binding EF-hand superfamily protein